MVLEKLKSLLSEQLNIAQEKITLEADIVNDLGADSLDVVELLMALEEQFKITVPDEKAAELKTIGDIVTYIENLKK